MNGLLTPNEVKEKLNVCYKTVIKYIRTGKLNASNIGTLERPRYRIKQEDLDDFLKGASGELREAQ